jgi:chromosome segregation ATPase
MRQKLILICTIALCFPLVLTGCDKGGEQKAELESVKAELNGAKAASRIAEAEKDKLKTELTAAIRTRDDLQGQVTRLTDGNRPLRDKVDRLTISNTILTKQATDLLASNKRLTGQLKEITDSSDQLKDEVAGLKSSNEGLQAQVHELTKQRDFAVVNAKESQDKIAELTAKLQTEAAAERELLVAPTVVSETPAAVEETPEVEAVKAATIHSFNTARAKIKKGQNATLSWHVSNAERISIEPDIGSVSALGSRNVKPSKTTTYTLTATGKGGETVETCKVEVR